MKRYSIFVLLLFVSTLVACAAERKSAKTANGFNGQKEEFVKAAQAKLDELDRGIEALLASAENPAAKAQQALDEQIVELVQAKNAAGRKLEYLRSAAEKTWPIFKTDMEEAINDLERSFNQLSEKQQLTQAR
jgi:hypothetical protein